MTTEQTIAGRMALAMRADGNRSVMWGGGLLVKVAAPAAFFRGLISLVSRVISQ